MKKKIFSIIYLILFNFCFAQNESQYDDSSLVLSTQQVQNLVAFTKLLGYIKYFHPSDEALKTNWDAYAISGIRKVEKAKNSEELLKILNNFFNPIAPTVKIFSLSQKEKNLDEKILPPPTANEIVFWQYMSYGQNNLEKNKKLIRIKLSDLSSSKSIPNPQIPYFAELSHEIACTVPITLYTDKKGTLPHIDNSNSALYYDSEENFSLNNRSVRLAATALCWNIFQHFFVYYDLLDCDWGEVLEEGLKEASIAKDSIDFYYALNRMIAKTHDAHAGAWPQNVHTDYLYKPPVIVDWIEDSVIVTRVDSTLKDKIQRGDIILEIDGEPVKKVIEKVKLQYSTSKHSVMDVVMNVILCGKQNTMVTVTVKSLIGNKNIVLKRIMWSGDFDREVRPPNISEIEPEIFYVNLEKVTKKDFKKEIENLNAAKGIIFDVRGYPTWDAEEILYHLVPAEEKFPDWFFIPTVKYPDHNNVEYLGMKGNLQSSELRSLKPYLKPLKVFITNASAQSWAESLMGIVEYYKLGEIIGEPTVGTNGGTNDTKLIGGFTVTFTGSKITKLDGARHFGVGTIPNIPYHRTIQGVRQGEDEILERAIQYLKTGN